ncbi:flagellar hook-associated protein 1 FlgK [Lachnospiraceae bacterium XBB2008]|nr:flagellar hook-associated protein 1 FlgK [Lachnospiraceae bacterium XBB2008]
MPSTFFGLQIAYSGLKASNAALNTTANNVANVETEGYSRQKVVTAASDPMRVFATYGCAGAGVDTLAIERVRDIFYDEKYRDNETRYGEFERKEYYMSVMETYFTDDNKTGFKSIFNKLVDTLEEVTKNSSSTSTKATFIAQAKTMTDYFNNMAGDLQDLQKDINDELKIQISQVNSIAEELATINKQINVIELNGITANELRDKRDVLIDDLSKYLDVQVKETPIYNALNEETGATRCIISVAGGQTLVDQNDFRTLEVVARNSWEKVYQTDADGLYDVYWSDGQKFNLDNAAMGGSIRGLADLRDGNNGNFFNGKVTAIGSDGTDHTVRIATTSDKLSTMAQCNLSNTGGRIILGNQEYYYKDWTVEYEKVDDGNGNLVDSDIVSAYIFTLDDEKCDMQVTSSKIGKEALMGSYSEYQGIPYYMAQMNEWVRLFAKGMNDIFTTGVTTQNEDAGILISGNLPTDRGQYSEDVLNNLDANTDNRGYYHITALNCSVEESLNVDPDLLGSRKDPSNGVEECDNVKKAIEVLRDKSQLSFRGYNASGFLESVLSDVALNTSNARTFSDTFLGLQSVLGNQRTSISGVDSDEEAVNLVKYENAYTLSSKMIQTFQEIYDRLILQTGV